MIPDKSSTKKTDAYEVEKLESALNDSATRISTIWVSFLGFCLYLMIAVAAVTHRQLLIDEPIRLPILGVDLPMKGFFFVAPLLLVALHAYVLLQVVLLSRTAAAYNEAVDRKISAPSANAFLRQRLANTLFTQMLSGSPRERAGLLGGVLKLIATATLVVIPAAVLLFIEGAFLPYHSHMLTWSHRAFLLLDVIVIVGLWPLVKYHERDLHWRFSFLSIKSLMALFVAVACSLVLHFPGEVFARFPLSSSSEQDGSKVCHTLLSDFDRLILPNVDVVDDDQLAKYEVATTKRQLPAYTGERTRDFRKRNFDCANLAAADLRRSDFSGASFTGASLFSAELEGSVFTHANFDRSVLVGAQLDGSLFFKANVHDTNLNQAILLEVRFEKSDLSGSNFDLVNLSNATCVESLFNGATFRNAVMTGIEVDFCQFMGSNFYGAYADGALFNHAKMQGIYFRQGTMRGTQLVGTDLDGADLSETRMLASNFISDTMTYTNLSEADLRGVTFRQTNLSTSNFQKANIWKSHSESCVGFGFDALRRDDAYRETGMDERHRSLSDKSTKEDIVAAVSRGAKDRATARINSFFASLDEPAEAADASGGPLSDWKPCAGEDAVGAGRPFGEGRVQQLQKLTCQTIKDNRWTFASILQAYEENPFAPSQAMLFARWILGVQAEPCGSEGVLGLTPDQLKVVNKMFAGRRW